MNIDSFMYMKRLDAAVGDTEIIADRYLLAEFSQPYVESGLVMVVKVEPEKKRTWMFLNTFQKEMWFLMAGMILFVGFVIWFIEKGDNPHFDGFGSMLWFSITVLFFVQSKSSS